MTETKIKTFCDEMRESTKKIHAISDALVNTKLAFSLYDHKVWADGLLIFYDVFMQLEKSLITIGKQCKIDDLITPELERTKAFESDLTYYLGKDWLKNHKPRDCVIKYINHLKELEDTNPILLIAYVYHLYMGLVSGGSILNKKRELMQKILPFKQNGIPQGMNVTNFGDKNMRELKEHIRQKVNRIAGSLSEETRQQLINESHLVFTLNNEIIKSVRGASAALTKRIFQALIFVIIAILICFYIRT